MKVTDLTERFYKANEDACDEIYRRFIALITEASGDGAITIILEATCSAGVIDIVVRRLYDDGFSIGDIIVSGKSSRRVRVS